MISFFCRARPQGSDAFEIFREAGYVFIGYPLLRNGEGYDPRNLNACLVSPDCCEEEWVQQTARINVRMYTRNRNFVYKVRPGSIVVVPRPTDGVVYIGHILGEFEIINAPPWGDRYLQLRREQNLDVDDENNHHIADVAQGWKVDEYRAIDYSGLPGWLRCSLFGRATYGEFRSHPLDNEVSAHSVLNDLFCGNPIIQPEWSLEPSIIKYRLVDTLSNPCAFENLVVALLQLENPDEFWHHTGGSGDGGIDGFGRNAEGRTVGLMQAKFIARNGQAPALGHFINGDKNVQRYIAVFLPEQPQEPEDGTCVLNLDWIAEKIGKHCDKLPLAHALRIGEESSQAR